MICNFLPTAISDRLDIFVLFMRGNVPGVTFNQSTIDGSNWEKAESEPTKPPT